MLTMSDISNATIAERIKGGDITTFEKVFREYYAPLTLFANGMLRDKETAEEIVQDFFYNLWKNRESIDIRISLKSYFYRSIRNKVLKHIRHESVKQRYAAEVLESYSAEETGYEPDVYELKELEKRVQLIMDNLPVACRQIFRMSRFERLTYKEIAQRMSISVKTVEANMSRALAEFRSQLKIYRG